MNPIYQINSVYNGAPDPGGAEEELRKFKGITEIIFDFTDVSVGDYEIIKIIADFNDESPILEKEFSFLDNSLIKSKIKHIFNPPTKTYTKIFYPTLYITFSNFKTFIYQTPILIAKDSFYTRYKKLDVAFSQFIDNSDNSMVVAFDTQDGDILNLKIK